VKSRWSANDSGLQVEFGQCLAPLKKAAGYGLPDEPVSLPLLRGRSDQFVRRIPAAPAQRCLTEFPPRPASSGLFWQCLAEWRRLLWLLNTQSEAPSVASLKKIFSETLCVFALGHQYVSQFSKRQRSSPGFLSLIGNPNGSLEDAHRPSLHNLFDILIKVLNSIIKTSKSIVVGSVVGDEYERYIL
jgi:hypothetical protein